MMKTNLRDNLVDFVQLWGCVTFENLKTLFSDYNAQTIKWNVNSLVSENILQIDDDNCICARRACPVTKTAKDAMMKALNVLVSFGEKNIRECYIARYPCQILFITEDNNVYDITVYTYANYKAIRQLAPQVRRAQAIPGIEDEIIHIAVVSDTDMIDEVAPVGYDSYCILDDNGKPVYYD